MDLNLCIFWWDLSQKRMGHLKSPSKSLVDPVSMGIRWVYPLVNVSKKTMERSTIWKIGKVTNFRPGHVQVCKLLNYQRVYTWRLHSKVLHPDMTSLRYARKKVVFLGNSSSWYHRWFSGQLSQCLMVKAPWWSNHHVSWLNYHTSYVL